MKLTEARTFLYWNFVDSTNVSIDDYVTCLVGKNESGKTAFLHALYQLNPAYENHLKPDTTNDYPRWRAGRDRRSKDLSTVTLVKGVFSLEDSDYDEINEVFTTFSPIDLPRDTQIVVKRTYASKILISLRLIQNKIIAAFIERASLSPEIKNQLISCSTIVDALTVLNDAKKGFDSENKAVLKDIKASIDLLDKTQSAIENIPKELIDAIIERLPKFFYFSNYSMLQGRIDLVDLLSKNINNMQDHERTALSLIKLANATGKEFQAENFEYRVSELETAANLITQEIFNYWTTNKDLVVKLEHDSQVIQDGNGQRVVHRFVDLRLNDLNHQVTTNFERRSSGFQWFFSFIAAFSEFENSSDSIIVLLDEPGLNLHAKAQHDFIRFINERLGKTCQVIYTTHSPFMVEPGSLHRVRLVEDLTTRGNPDIGAKVSEDILSVNGDTLFPLQAALGYDLAQNLFIGQHNLIVEGPSDFIYLNSFSEHLASLGRASLNEKWSFVPVGGADKIPTFVALLGSHLNVTVLLDASGKGNQRLMDMVSHDILSEKRVLTVDKVTKKSKADIEDLFEPSEYLTLYNQAFHENINEKDLTGQDPILKQIERYVGHSFLHTPPATQLLKLKADFLENISSETLNRFEELIKLINNTMSE